MRYLSIIFTLISALTYAQGFQRQFKLPSSLYNASKAIYEMSPGNYLAGGIIIETVSSQTSNRLVIMGLNANGQLQWTKKYGNNKFEYLDNSLLTRWFYKSGNNLYYTGCARDSNNKQVGVLMKFDTNGDTLWQKIYRDNIDDLVPQRVNASCDGGFLITGMAQVTLGGTDVCLVLKTDANGNELWRKKISKAAPNASDGRAIIQDSASKKIAIAGYQYLSNSTSSSATYDHVLILDSLGNKLKQLFFTGSYGGVLSDLIQTKDKKIVAVGMKYTSNVVGTYRLSSSFALKFDIDTPTVPIWKIDGYDSPGLYNSFYSATELNDGSLIFGSVIDTMYVDTLNVNNFTRLTKVGKNGDIKWSRYYDYKNNSANLDNYQAIRCLNPTFDGGFISAIEVFNSQSVNPMFFVKYDSTGCDSSTAHCATLNLVSLPEAEANNADFKIYPNPANDFLIVENSEQETEICIMEVSGRKIETYKLKLGSKININKYEPGVYFVTVTCQRHKPRTYKLLIVR